MADPNGWPDASKPGVPLNPEKHGWHWLAWDATWPEPAYWDGEWSQPDKSNLSVRTARYLGPCPTPQEVAAREQAAAEEMRAICARAAMVELGWNNGSVEARKAIAMQAAHTVNAIRERPIPSSDALAAALAQARREGMEEASRIADAVMQQAAACAREPDLIPNIRREYLAQSRGAEDVRDAIRAKAQEARDE